MSIHVSSSLCRSIGPDGESAIRDCGHYRIIRFYFRGGSRTIARGLTLAEAQAHCRNPETSSSTATGAKARAVVRRHGAFFDGYDHE